MTSKFKFSNSLEWCTELPSKDSTRKSPVFLVSGNEWFFSFSLEKQSEMWTFFLYLEFKCTHTEFKPYYGKLQVGYMEEEAFRVSNKAFEVPKPKKTQIWFTPVQNFQPKPPSDYLNCKGVKFTFHFDVEDESALKINKEVEDKCIQTGWYLNTDVSVEKLSEDFSKLLDSGPNHDAEIKCGEHSMKTHRSILCARSDVFHAMLESDMLEGRTGIVEIEDMKINDVQDFVKYLYTGTMPELTVDKAKILYKAGDKYAVRGLMLRCSEYLQDNLSEDEILPCFALADMHSDRKLKKSIMTYILEKKVYLQSELWLPFCDRFPKEANKVYRLSYEKTSEQ